MKPPRLSPRELVEQVPDGTTFTRAAVLELLDSAGEIAEGSPGQVAKLLGPERALLAQGRARDRWCLPR